MVVVVVVVLVVAVGVLEVVVVDEELSELGEDGGIERLGSMVGLRRGELGLMGLAGRNAAAAAGPDKDDEEGSAGVSMDLNGAGWERRRKGRRDLE